jgi:threonine 3-dehydrogenase
MTIAVAGRSAPGRSTPRTFPLSAWSSPGVWGPTWPCTPKDPVIDAVRQATDSEGVDAAAGDVGAPQAIDQALPAKPRQAALLGVALFFLRLESPLGFKAARVQGISGRRLWQTWYQARGLIRAGAVDLSPMVTHRFALSDFDRAFEAMASGESGKVMLTP